MSKTLQIVLAALLVMAMLGGCVPQKAEDTPAQEPSPASSKEVVETADTTEASGNFNAEGLPILNETESFEMAAKSRHNKNFAELQFFQELEEETNVHIDWNMSTDDGWNEKKGLLFAGELPDAFYGQGILSDIDVVKYASQGILIPLEELIDQYAPNVKKLLENDEYRKALTAPDGHIYALPSLTELSPTTHDKLFVNKTWLDTLGMDVPETLDELKETLIAFRDTPLTESGKASDQIPFSFLYDRKENGLFSLFGSFGQVDTGDHFIVKDGAVTYTAITEPYKEAIQYFNELYKEGLIDKEGFTHDFNVYIAKIKAPEKTVGSFVGWSLSSAAGPNKEDYVAMAPFKGPDGKQIWNTYPSPINAKGSFVITKNCENPEALLRWIDMHYDPETSLQIDQGLIGRTLEKAEDGTFHYLPVPEGKSFTEMIHDYSPGVNGVSAVTMDVASKLELNANLQERAELDEFFSPYNVPADQVLPDMYLTVEEAETISILETDLTSYVDQCYANWIVHGGIENEWDGYLKKLDEMGLQEYIQIYQDAYDRYQSQ